MKEGSLGRVHVTAAEATPIVLRYEGLGRARAGSWEEASTRRRGTRQQPRPPVEQRPEGPPQHSATFTLLAAAPQTSPQEWPQAPLPGVPPAAGDVPPSAATADGESAAVAVAQDNSTGYSAEALRMFAEASKRAGITGSGAHFEVASLWGEQPLRSCAPAVTKSRTPAASLGVSAPAAASCPLPEQGQQLRRDGAAHAGDLVRPETPTLPPYHAILTLHVRTIRVCSA